VAVLFLDCETTGLRPQLGHVPYEIALIDEADAELTLWVDPSPDDLARADPDALRISRFYQRRPSPNRWLPKGVPGALEAPTSLRELASLEQPVCCSSVGAAFAVARLTAGAHLVAAAPAFDAGMLAELLGRHKLTPAWHYHLVDVEALAAGKLGRAPPWDSHALTADLGVPETNGDQRHTALGDARWVRDVYRAIIG
jgi:DNA polymerase III epsilon subunit-like protein